MNRNGLRPIHPGEILREDFLKPLVMSAHTLANALHITLARIDAIVNEDRGISPLATSNSPTFGHFKIPHLN
jgi:addiction module HigA family antidote